MVWEVIKKIMLSGIVSWIIYLVIKFIIDWRDWNMQTEIDKKYAYYYVKYIKKWTVILSISIFSLLIFLILFF